MLKQNIKSKSGFTIIEVVLVLAIAGLIFLMVFVALPALQRSQRDTQRRNDYAALSTSVTNYMTNNNGKLPVDSSNAGVLNKGCKTAFSVDQINSEGTDPTGSSYIINCQEFNSSSDAKVLTNDLGTVKTITYTVQTGVDKDGKPITEDIEWENGKPSSTVSAKVYVISHATCVDGVPSYSTSARSFAVYGALESGTYCNSSS